MTIRIEPDTQHDSRIDRLRSERNVLARLLGDAISERNAARTQGDPGSDLASREALVSRLLARTAEVDTMLLRARVAAEAARESFPDGEEHKLAGRLGLVNRS